MVKSIVEIFNKLKKMYKLKNFYLASGGLVDVKGAGTSDVDIVYITKDYNDIDIFKGAKKEPRPDKNRCYYKFNYGGREVAICASDDEAVMRSVIHRKNELMLNEFPNIRASAIVNKMNKKNTETAYVMALGIEIDNPDDVYDIMLDTKKLKKIATERKRKINTIIKNLNK